MTTQLIRYRFTVDDYHLMGKVGIIPPDARVELLNGEVVEMAPIGPAHVSGVIRHTVLLGSLFAGVAYVSAQNLIRTDNFGEPQPDIALVRLRADYYQKSIPTLGDIFLLIEIGDSTAADDRRNKMLLYARAGVPELWLEDIGQDALTVCRDPGPDGYRSVQVLRRGDRVAVAAFPDREIAVADLLGDPS